jgi:hypothetical protein
MLALNAGSIGEAVMDRRRRLTKEIPQQRHAPERRLGESRECPDACRQLLTRLDACNCTMGIPRAARYICGTAFS